MIFKALFSLILSIFGYPSHDQIWFETAQKMAAANSPDEMRAILDEKLPGFVSKLEKDATQNRKLIELWGMSRNIDESHLTDGTLTVPANVLRYFNSIFKLNFDSTFTHGHAGLTHTYGYLMSNLSTPYGFKRARYVAGEIESGFGLPSGTFSGLPSHGTLLSNLTLFAGPFAFPDHPELLAGIKSEVPEIANFNHSRLKVMRLVEMIKNERYTLEIHTDIVPFADINTHGKNRALLIYSIDFHATGHDSQPRLITVFPIESNFTKSLFVPADLGDRVAIKLKYNAALPIDIPLNEMVGKRFITHERPAAEHSSP